MSEGFGLLTLNPGAGASLEIHLCAFKAVVSALITLKYFPPDHLLRGGSCWPRPGHARSHQPGPEWGAGGVVVGTRAEGGWALGIPPASTRDGRRTLRLQWDILTLKQREPVVSLQPLGSAAPRAPTPTPSCVDAGTCVCVTFKAHAGLRLSLEAL